MLNIHLLGEVHSSSPSIFHSMEDIHQLLFIFKLSFIINIYKDDKKGSLNGKIKHLFEIMSSSYSHSHIWHKFVQKQKNKFKYKELSNSHLYHVSLWHEIEHIKIINISVTSNIIFNTLALCVVNILPYMITNIMDKLTMLNMLIYFV
jgi:hypothetical protein